MEKRRVEIWPYYGSDLANDEPVICPFNGKTECNVNCPLWVEFKETKGIDGVDQSWGVCGAMRKEWADYLDERD